MNEQAVSGTQETSEPRQLAKEQSGKAEQAGQGIALGALSEISESSHQWEFSPD
jgi:hypothetical protein